MSRPSEDLGDPHIVRALATRAGFFREACSLALTQLHTVTIERDRHRDEIRRLRAALRTDQSPRARTT